MSSDAKMVVIALVGSMAFSVVFWSVILWIYARRSRRHDLRRKNDGLLDSIDDLLKRPRK